MLDSQSFLVFFPKRRKHGRVLLVIETLLAPGRAFGRVEALARVLEPGEQPGFHEIWSSVFFLKRSVLKVGCLRTFFGRNKTWGFFFVSDFFGGP